MNNTLETEYQMEGGRSYEQILAFFEQFSVVDQSRETEKIGVLPAKDIELKGCKEGFRQKRSPDLWTTALSLLKEL